MQGFLPECSSALLINNAGTVQPVGPAGAQDLEKIAKAIALNVTAPLMLASAFVAASNAGDKRIIHIVCGRLRGDCGDGARRRICRLFRCKLCLRHGSRVRCSAGAAGNDSGACGDVQSGADRYVRADDRVVAGCEPRSTRGR